MTYFWYDCGHLKGEELKTCDLETTDRYHPPPTPKYQYLDTECCKCEKLELTLHNAALVEERKDEAAAYLKELRRQWKNQYATMFSRKKKEAESRLHADRSIIIESEPIGTLASAGGGAIKNEIDEGRKGRDDIQPKIEETATAEELADYASMMEDAMLLLDFAKEARIFPQT